MYIGGLFIDDEKYAIWHKPKEGRTVIPCQYCGRHLIPTSNIRSKSNYCQDCANKVSILGKYESGSYHPNQEERAKILSSMTRAGR